MQGGSGERDNLDEREEPEEGRGAEKDEIKEIRGGGGRGGEKGSKEGESKNPAVDPTSVHRDPPVSDQLDLGQIQEEERKEEGKITQDEEEDGEDNKNLEQVEDEEDEDCSPRVATQLSLHEELRMSSSFANHSDNEDDPEVRVEDVEEEDEVKDEEERGDDDEEGDGEQGEEEGGDPMSLFLPHKPFCGRLTSSALSKAEEFSETETYSSGFSEDYKMTLFKPVHRQTQTCDRELADISSPVNDLDSHFQTTPRYKVIFKEIFQVLEQANKVDLASRQDGRNKHVIWQGSYSSLGKTPNCPEEEASARVPSKEYQRDSLKPKTLPTKEYQSFAPRTTFTDYSSLPPSSLSSMASMARLKQLQESYASVLRRGIQDA